MQNVEEKNIYCLTSWQNTNICKNYEIIIFFYFRRNSNNCLLPNLFQFVYAKPVKKKIFFFTNLNFKGLDIQIKVKGTRYLISY